MRYIAPLLLLFILFSCKEDKNIAEVTQEAAEEVPIIEKYGFVYNDFKVVEDTIEKGESFGEILDRNHLQAYEVYKIAEAAKDTFDVRRLRAGKPYTILAKNDTTEKAQVFIYQPNKIEYVVIDFRDSVTTKYQRKAIKTITKTASGIINSTLSETISDQKLDYDLVNELSDIYAWTVDFFHLQKGDNFKIIYEEKFVDDTTFVGIGKVKAAYFEHKNSPFYAFNYVTDSTKNIFDFYDESAGNLRRQFLKAPLQFRRISSRYNLKRKIRFYGRVKAHRGTDFAARVGTPIKSTANGTVIESARRGGNGNYVKIRHNSIYMTQYLHMSKRNVKVGDYVKQGDVIGWVGMTGNTSGPHVCYRFWKNGVQVDPFKQKLPSAEPLREEYKENYFQFIAPLKTTLDAIAVNEPAAFATISEDDL
ncbi:MAG: peptidoglycan DD-metalloendopeptidase family protein [Flavobacteriaceae bacterium]|nr:peptidoglycan DD-metalloendopeptidase family protein [Flavobacteriaceae bacterium]